MPAAAKTTSPKSAPKIETFDRFRGVLDGAECACKNGHITPQAALACVKPAKGSDLVPTTVTFDRFKCTTGEHKYGHKTEKDALACAGFRTPKATAKPAAATPAAAKPATAAKGATASKPSAPAKPRLRSAKAGQISRA